jgi:hypothetical protein
VDFTALFRLFFPHLAQKCAAFSPGVHFLFAVVVSVFGSPVDSGKKRHFYVPTWVLTWLIDNNGMRNVNKRDIYLIQIRKRTYDNVILRNYTKPSDHQLLMISIERACCSE